MLMKQQSFANRNAILWQFSVPLMTRWHINWYYYADYVQKAHQSSTWQTESVSQRAGYTQLNE